MQVGRVERVKAINCSHRVMFDECPTFLEKEVCEAVWPRSLVCGQIFDGFPRLLLRNRVSKVMQG